jgi:negative regulator of flagellin synthesis FlgM
MINKIPSFSSSPYSDVGRVGSRPEVQQEATRQANQSSAELTLSDDAKAIQQAIQSVKDLPEVRQDLVNQIKGDIETGRYQVNAQTLADSLIGFMQ